MWVTSITYRTKSMCYAYKVYFCFNGAFKNNIGGSYINDVPGQILLNKMKKESVISNSHIKTKLSYRNSVHLMF